MKLIIPFLLLLSACDLDSKKTGIPQYSYSIEDSKKNGVFHQALKVDKAIIKIDDNNTDTIKQIWLESAWSYERKGLSATVKKNLSYQNISILFGSLSREWNNKILLRNHEGYFGQSGSVFFRGVASTKNLQNKDTVLVISKMENQADERILDTLIISK